MLPDTAPALPGSPDTESRTRKSSANTQELLFAVPQQPLLSFLRIALSSPGPNWIAIRLLGLNRLSPPGRSLLRTFLLRASYPTSRYLLMLLLPQPHSLTYSFCA